MLKLLEHDFRHLIIFNQIQLYIGLGKSKKIISIFQLINGVCYINRIYSVFITTSAGKFKAQIIKKKS